MQTDYLIVGAGAMGMAFADTLLTETDFHLTIVDRYHRPGGHWNLAYPFVRLHQPSAFYGVNSKALGSNLVDRVGWNKGLYELATGDEVVAYFTQVMQQRFLPSERVTYLPLTEYDRDGHCRSLLTGEAYEIEVRRRIVDASYMRVTVPSMRPAPYEVSDAVDCVPPNELARIRTAYGHYTVVGAGKTAVDSLLWLLANGVDSSMLTWIVPRDPWLSDRAWVQPGEEFREIGAKLRAARGAAILAATSVDDLFERLIASGEVFRLSRDVQPTMYRCATVSEAEFEQLLKIKDIVRLGRVRRIEERSVVLDHGSAPAHANTLYIDCTADGLERRPPVPVFNGRHITLQSVRVCQQVFSAAFIAHIEASYSDETLKNDICMPIPHPNETIDYLRVIRSTLRNSLRWSEEPGLGDWLRQSRLDWLSRYAPPLPSDPSERAAALSKMRDGIQAQIAKLDELLRQSA